jgi:hypothetical protein
MGPKLPPNSWHGATTAPNRKWHEAVGEKSMQFAGAVLQGTHPSHRRQVTIRALARDLPASRLRRSPSDTQREFLAYAGTSEPSKR